MLNELNKQIRTLERYEQDAYNALVNYRDYEKEIIVELENNFEEITKEIDKLNINTKVASLPNLKNISSRLSMTTGTERFNLLMQKEYSELKPIEPYNTLLIEISMTLIDYSKDKLCDIESRVSEGKRTIEILMSKLRNMIIEVKSYLYKDKY